MAAPVIIESPSPHDYLDRAISRINNEQDLIKRAVHPCSGCPDEDICHLAGEPSALTRCNRLMSMRARGVL